MRRVWLAGALILLGAAALVATFGLGGLRASAERSEAERWRVHSFEVLVDTKSLSIALREMQRGQRGFLLTDDPAYLGPYQNGLRDSGDILAALRRKTVNDAFQQEKLATLMSRRDALRDELAATLAMAAAGRKADALALVRSGEGRRHMLRIEALMEQMVAYDRRLLAQRDAAADAADKRVQRYTLILTLLGAGLLIAASLLGLLAMRTHLKHAEIDALLKTVLRSIQGAVFAKDGSGRYKLMSEVGARLFGRPIEAIIGHTDAELRPPLFAAQVAEHDAQAVAAGGPVGFDETVEVNGKALVLRTTRTPLHDIGGTVIGIAGVALDVSARHEAEAALSVAAAEASAVFELAAIGIAQADPASRRLLKVNRKMCEITGYGAAELLTLKVDDLNHPDDAAACRQTFQRLLAGEGPQRIEKRYIRKDGSITWINASVALACGADGAPLRTVAMIEEVTAQKHTEYELTKTAALLRAIIEATPGLIYAKDRAGRMILANGPTLNLVGKRWEEIDGRTDAELLNDGVQAGAIMENDQHIMTANVVQTLEERVSLPDGSPRTWLSTKAPLHDQAGAVIGLVGVSVDITMRKDAEAELRSFNETLTAKITEAVEAREAALAQLHEAQKMETIGQLTGGVAHDFNNLLTPILGNLDMLRRRVPETDDRAQRLISSAIQAADRAGVLVARLLAFARRQRLEPRAVDLRALTLGMEDLIKRSLGPMITVIVDIPAGLPPAFVDPNQLELALLNLSVNARDAMPNGGELTFSARTEQLDAPSAGMTAGDYVRLMVSDTGIGMDAVTLSRAMEPFFSSKPHGKGTGLGLSMAQGLAAQSGGALKLASALGEGTRVDMWLPLAKDGVPAAPIAASLEYTGPRTRPLDLLVVDDEELVRLGTVDMLVDLGHRVIEAASGMAALDILQQGTACDLLVTDYLMPGMSGVQLVKEARKLRPGMPALLVTGYANMVEAQDEDIRWVGKPFRQADLARRIAELIAAPQSEGR